MEKSKRARTRKSTRTKRTTRIVTPGGALDLENGLGHMTSARAIAKAIKRAADAGSKKTAPFDSAMAAVAYLIHHLETQLARLREAQRELLILYGQTVEEEPQRLLRLISDERTAAVRARRKRTRNAMDLAPVLVTKFLAGIA